MPRPGSARAANGARPAVWESPRPLPITDALSHGSAASTVMTKTAVPQRIRLNPVPGVATHTSATMAASITPVGVSPASAIQNTTATQSVRSAGPVLNRTTAAATQGRVP